MFSSGSLHCQLSNSSVRRERCGRVLLRSLVFGIPVSLQPNIENHIVQSSSWDVAELSQSSLVYRTICLSRRVIDAVQGCSCVEQCSGGPQNSPFEMDLLTLRLCNSSSSMPAVPSLRDGSVIRVDQYRSHHPHKNWPCSLTRTCCFGWGERFRCSLLLPFKDQSSVELMAVCQGAGNFGTSPDFSDCAGVPRHKNPS